MGDSNGLTEMQTENLRLHKNIKYYIQNDLKKRTQLTTALDRIPSHPKLTHPTNAHSAG